MPNLSPFSVSALRSWIEPILWYGLLLLTIPLIQRQWSAADFIWYDYLYLIFCLLVCFLFISVGKRRRLVLLAFAVTLSLFVSIGLDRVVIVILSLAALVILYEAIRQNIPFFRDCHRKQVPVGRLIYRSFILWSPLMVFLYLGVMANSWILDTSRDFIYQTLPMVDEYCTASTVEGERVYPCSGMQEVVKREDIKSLTLEENIKFHIRGAFLNRQKEILDDLKKLRTSDNMLLMNKNQFRDIIGKMRPRDILTTDEQILSLFKESDKLSEQKKRSKDKAEREKIDEQGKKLFEEATNIAKQKYSDVDLVIGEEEKKKNPKWENWMTVGVVHLLLVGHLDATFKRSKDIMINRDANRLGWRRLRSPVKKIKIRESKLAEYFMTKLNGFSDETENHIVGLQAKQGNIKTSKISLSVRKQNMKMVILAILDVEPQCTTHLHARPFPCFAIPKEGLSLDTVGLWKSVDESIDFWHEQRVRSIQENFRTVVKGVKEGKVKANDASNILFEKSIPKSIPGLVPNGDCAWYSISCNVSDDLINKANAGYENERKIIKKKYNGAVKEATTTAERETLNQLWLAKEKLSIALDESVLQMHKTVESMIALAIILSALLTFILVLAVIKSFLYVLSTELFDSRELANIELDRGENIEGEFVAGPSMTIPLSFKRPLITKTVLDNQALRKVIAAWPFSAPLGRILKGSYFFFNKGSHRPQSSNPMSFSQAEGKSIVDWQMQEGEEVVFHYRNFFGASDNVKLKTTISLRLPTLLLGRFVFHSAYCSEGTGKLLLVTNGKIIEDQSTIDSTPLDRLIAYNKHTKFKVDSERTVRSVFMDGYTIVRVKEEGRPSGLILVEAIGSQRSMLSGSLRFVKSLLLPF